MVKKEWSVTKGLKEVAYLAKYYAIFRDIFGGKEFMPAVWLDVHYNKDSVHRGNILEPAKVGISIDKNLLMKRIHIIVPYDNIFSIFYYLFSEFIYL